MRKFVFILLIIAVASPRTLHADDLSSVRLLVGRSAIIDVGSAIQRVSLTSADVADAVVTSANQLLINGKMPGTISMYVWERGGGLKRYEVVVQRDLASLNEQMKQLFPGEAIEAQSSGKGIVLSGMVSSKDVFDKASNVAGGYVEKAAEVVNLLRLQETQASNQVLLRVRFAEVSRSAMTDLGASLFTSQNGYKDVIGRTTTQQQAAPGFENSTPAMPMGEKMVFSDFLNLFLFDAKHQLGTVIKALQSKGQFQSLAEPNLVAESGKEASFLAGGEFPVPVAQGSGSSVAISVQYKEFGIRLNFTPTVIGSRVHLKVRPEVSTLDFANGVLLQGFRIPALSTRRTETELELLDGQTFAIAGLMNNTVNSTLQKIPGIGDIPILGLLFQSKAAQKNQTELVVMITPQILPRNSNGVTGHLPRTPEQFLPPMPAKKLVDPPAPAFSPARQGFTPTGSGADAAAAVAPATKTSASDESATAAAVKAAVAAATANAAAAAAAAAPVAVAQPQPPATAAPAARPMTSDEKKAQERAQKLAKAEQEKQAKLDKENQERQAKLAKAQEKAEQEHQAQAAREQAKAAREQAKRDADAARKQQK
jgi:pilus assembly protein CpaC